MEGLRGKRMQMVRVMDIEKRKIPSKHYVFVLEITWSDGTQNVVYRRYSHFFSLQTSLIDAFPVEGGVKNPAERILPFLPGKVLFRSNVREVALKRKSALDEYCKTLVKLPEKILSSDHVTSFFEPSEEDVSNFTDSLKRDASAKSKKGKKADVISDPVLLEQYIALSDFRKCGKGQVNLVAGDVVEVIEKSDNGWFFVNIETEQGWVPCSYLEPADGSKENAIEKCLAEEKYVCVKPYKKALDDEMDLELGAIVDIVQKSSDGWWEVRFRGQLGWVPRAHLKSAAHLELSKQTLSIGIVRDRESLRIVAGKSKVGVPPRRRTVRKSVPRSVMQTVRRESLTPESEYVATSDYQLSIGTTKASISEGQSYTVVERAPNGWSLIKFGGEEAWVPSEILNRRRKENITFNEEDELYQNVRSLSINEESENFKNEVNNNVSIQDTENGTTEESFVTIGSYVSADESGISFKENVNVIVLEKNDSGWWYIKIGSDEGWAPSTYLKPVKKTREVKKTIVSGPDVQSKKFDISLVPPKPNRRSHVPQSYENFDVVDGEEREEPPRTATAPRSPKPKPRTDRESCSTSPPIAEMKSIFSRQRAIMKSQSVEEHRTPSNGHAQSKLRKISEPVQKPPRPEKGPSPVNSKGKITPPVPTRPVSSTATQNPSPPIRPVSSTAAQNPSPPIRPVSSTAAQNQSPQDKAFRTTPPVPTRPTPTKGELFETICDYNDDDEGMLSFKVGEKVHVLEKDDGGWWLAMIGVKKGWVPSNFLQKV